MTKTMRFKDVKNKLAMGLILLGGLSGVVSLALRSINAPTQVEAATKEGILRMAISVEPSSLDPHLIMCVEEQSVVAGLFEGLLVSDPHRAEPQPGVAERWEVDASGRVYTFYLRKNAQWSDGQPLTARDFEFAFKRALRGVPCQLADQFDVLAGAHDYRLGRTHGFNSLGIEVVGDHILRFTLENPTPYFLSLLTHWIWSPLPQHVLQKFGAESSVNTPWTRPGNLVGNGPFVLEKHARNSHLELKRNPHYWDPKNIHLNGLHISFKTPGNQKMAFAAGDLHLATEAPLYAEQRYSNGQANPYFRAEPYLGTCYFVFNTEHAALKDVRVRQALSLAVDRNAIVSRVSRSNETPAYTLIPPQIPGYKAPKGFLEDPPRAQKLLAQAGYPEGKGFPKLELLFSADAEHKLLAEALQAMWKSVLGIDIELVSQELKSYLVSRKEGKFALLRASWVGDYIDPYTFLSVWHTHSDSNYARWRSEAYDTLLASSAKEADPQARYALLNKAEAMLLKNLPMMPLYFFKSPILVHPDVNNLKLNLLRWYNYKGVALEPSGE